MGPTAEQRELAETGADIVRDAFLWYSVEFRRLTLQAARHFDQQDWLRAQRDSVERLELYTRVVRTAVATLRYQLGEQARAKNLWRAMKQAYFARVADRADVELAETFYNSMTRRIFTTVGVDSEVEFVASEVPERSDSDPGAATVPLPGVATNLELGAMLLARHSFESGWQDAARDAERIARVLDREFDGVVPEVRIVPSVFYRGKGAYLVGAASSGGRTIPLCIALLNQGTGVFVDAVLTAGDEVSVVFSFARSYFMVDAERPHDLVRFLLSIMPRKPVNELYNAIGHNKHGKTEFYRGLLRHLATCEDRFEIAPGVRGMVMVVFLLPGYDAVFKIIRDRFDPPKTVTREDVLSRYQMVFKHDRAGRLVDAQEFEHLEFPRRLFAPDLIEELAAKASETVTITETSVVIRHLYTERRLVPLDLFLRQASPEDARHAVVEYGLVLRDLAATNIFPGDLLLKNFGVSRHGRLIFYDYDELCLVTECNFRALPEPRSDLEDSYEEPWFYVGEKDIFPEEFLPFLGFRGELRKLFLEVHGELLTPQFWTRMQDEHRAGHVLDIFPYGPSKRLTG